MAVNLSPVGGVAAQFFDNSGQVLTGGKLYSYLAGTTTPAVTYTTSTGITAQPNPIILNAAGRVPDSGEIWLTDSISYKFVLKDQNDVLIATYDNIIGINSNFINFTGEEETQTATQGQTVFILTTLEYIPATNNLLVFVNGSKQIIGDNYIETSSTVVTFIDKLNVGDVVDFCTATPINTTTIAASAVSFTGFKGQIGNVQDLAGDDGSDWVGFLQNGTGAAARSAQDKMRDVVSVKDFGATGDGVTDDTVAIQATIDSLTDTGGIVNFPPGNYLITSVITITGSSICLQGPAKSVNSYGNGVLIKTANNIEMFKVLGGWCLFNSLGLYCSNNAHTYRHIQSYSADQLSVINCYIQGVDSGGSATGSGIGFGNGSGGNGGSIGLVDKCIIDNGGIDVFTSDVHITNSYVWANTRPWAIKAIASTTNLCVDSTDIIPPRTTVTGGKAGIYLTGAVLQPRINNCYFDGNAVLSTGTGLLAENGVLGLIVSNCTANLVTNYGIVLDSVIAPIVTGCSFYNGNKARTGTNDILLQQNFAQAMTQPKITNNTFIQTQTTTTGTAGAAIRLLAGTSRVGIKIENNSIFQQGTGNGYLEQEIQLDSGAFASSTAGSLKGNVGTRMTSIGSGNAAFTTASTSVTINIPITTYYLPRYDQVRVTVTGAALAYWTFINASAYVPGSGSGVTQIQCYFTAPSAGGTVYVHVDLD
jgi:hypothetical protein